MQATLEEWRQRAREAEAEAARLRQQLVLAQSEALRYRAKVERVEKAIRIAEGYLDPELRGD